MKTKTGCIGEEIARDLDRLTTARIDALSESAGAQIGLRALLQHEARRIEHKFGSESPRAQRLRARVQANAQQIHALAVEGERFQVKVPEVAEDGALIHGRVVDEDERGIVGLMICLVDQRNTPVRGADEPTTDESGYFAITLDPALIDKLVKDRKTDVFLAVFTGKRRLVHREPKPLALVKGARLTAEIRLNRRELTAGGPVTPPPPEPKTVTVPELVGKSEDEAVSLLQEAGLKPGARKTRPAPNEIGRVLAQDPQAGAEVPIGTVVDLVVGRHRGEG